MDTDGDWRAIEKLLKLVKESGCNPDGQGVGCRAADGWSASHDGRLLRDSPFRFFSTATDKPGGAA